MNLINVNTLASPWLGQWALNGPEAQHSRTFIPWTTCGTMRVAPEIQRQPSRKSRGRLVVSTFCFNEFNDHSSLI